MNARWWALGVGLASVASVTCLLALRPHFGRPKVTLPGGATMILERVEVGNVHRLVLGYPALKKLQKFLPSFVYSRLPQSAEETIHYPRVNLGFWFSCTGLGAWPSFKAPQIIDEHGCVFRVREWTPRTLRGQQFWHFSADVFPRHSKTLTFAVNLLGQDVRFQLKPALTSSKKPWQPEPLPITRLSGHLTVALTNSVMRLDTNGTFRLEPEFELLESGRPANESWALAWCEYADPGGNLSAVAYQLPLPDSPSYMGLCRYEPALKLKVAFRRTAGASFSTNELWAIKDLKRPEAGTIRLLGQSRFMCGMSLDLISLDGPGEITYSNNVPIEARPVPDLATDHTSSWGTSQDGVWVSVSRNGSASLAFATDGIMATTRLLMFLEDERGRKIEQRPYSRGRDGLHIHCLQWPDDLPEANLNIVVEKGDDLAPENIATTKTVEFVVKPPKRLSQAREPTP